MLVITRIDRPYWKIVNIRLTNLVLRVTKLTQRLPNFCLVGTMLTLDVIFSSTWTHTSSVPSCFSVMLELSSTLHQALVGQLDITNATFASSA